MIVDYGDDVAFFEVDEDDVGTITCPGCEQEVNDVWIGKTCPYCGEKLEVEYART